jgi:hypothetical protein
MTSFLGNLRGLAVAVALAAAGSTIAGCGGDDDNAATGGSSGTTSGGPKSDGGRPDAGGTIDAAIDSGVDTVVTPTFDPLPGEFDRPIAGVRITTTTPGAQIFFTLDGTPPTPGSTPFTTPIPINQTRTIRAVATKAGLNQSGVANGVFVIRVDPGKARNPTFNPPGGQYGNTQSVSIASETPGATICYTLTGTDPGACVNGACAAGAQTYVSASPVPIGTQGTEIRARACTAALRDSDVSRSGIYTFKAAAATSQTAQAPSTIASGTQADFSTITIGGIIRYTTDGEAPPTCVTGTALGQSGSTPPITHNTVFHTIVCKAGYTPSDLRDFDFRVAAAPPTIVPAPGPKTDDIGVTITAGPDADLICYSLDGAIPRCSAGAAACVTGAVYTSAIPVQKNTTVTAVACGGRSVPAHDASAPATATYTFGVAPIRVTNGDGLPGDTTTELVQVTNGSSQTVSLSVSYAGGTINHANGKICFRTDGVEPTCSPSGPGIVQCGAGSVAIDGYSGTLPAASAPFVVKAIACAPDFANSPPRKVVYADATAAPILSLTPPPGTYDNDQTLVIGVAPADARICVAAGAQSDPDPVCSTAGGVEQCTSGSTYAGPIPITADGTYIKAVACKVGFAQQSLKQEGAYNLIVGTPTITPNGGTANEGMPITFASSTTGATFHYTVGFPTPEVPTCASPNVGSTYSFTETSLKTQRVSVIACKAGYQSSPVVTSNPFTSKGLAPPTIDVPGGTYTNALSVTMQTASASAPGARICYTTDGTNPTCAVGSNICDSPTPGSNVVGGSPSGTTVSISSNAFGTLRAITCATGFAPSTPVIASYTLAVSPLTISPTPGTYSAAQTVTISQQPAPPNPTSGSRICFRTDGSDPAVQPGSCIAQDASTTCVDGPTATLPPIVATTTVKYFGCKVGFDPWPSAPPATASYTINAYARTITIDGQNEFVDAENAIATTDAVYTAYLSWDATNIYVGLKGADVGTPSATSYVHLYVRAGGSPATSTTRDTLGGNEFGTENLPTSFSHHVYWRTDDADPNRARYWTGTNWGNAPALSASIALAKGGSGADTFVEIAIPRSGAGGAPQGLNNVTQLLLVGGLAKASANALSFPGGGAIFARYIDANMASFVAPNASSNVKP